MNFIIFGAPGSGKGTQAKLLAEHLNIQHISSGDVCRELIRIGDKKDKKVIDLIGKYINLGKLVPNYLINKMMKDRLDMQDVKRGFILDGYPRNIEQAEFLSGMVKDLGVIILTVSPEAACKRIAGRITCRCGLNYNLITKPPVVAGVCDVCKARLFKREDDVDTVIKYRISVYNEATKPVIDYYRSQEKGLIFEINGERPVEEIFQDIINQIRFKIDYQN